ncbi:MAG: hypothetical protein KGL39_18985 [Patescibacteria group bacterium]|nr:hypothetical protein [Patescibacteria group bacterium]
MQRITEFAPADRYLYDFRVCTTDKGWAQLDTRQDASYFGNWVNPFDRKIFTYCEGDTTLVICESDEEFTAEIERIFAWHEEHDGKRPGIDPGFNKELKAQFEQLGLAALLH